MRKKTVESLKAITLREWCRIIAADPKEGRRLLAAWALLSEEIYQMPSAERPPIPYPEDTLYSLAIRDGWKTQPFEREIGVRHGAALLINSGPEDEIIDRIAKDDFPREEALYID